MGIKTKPQLFIIESLDLEDEKKNLKEGHIISNMLHLSGKEKTEYCYIRTSRELEEMIKIFGESKHRYLHISCHANKSEFRTTFDDIKYAELGEMLRPHLSGRRVFVSACKMANRTLARELFRDSGLLSLTGPQKDIYMDDAAAFWVSFYHLMFKIDSRGMKKENLRETIGKLSAIYDEPINCFLAAKKQKSGFKRVTFPPPEVKS